MATTAMATSFKAELLAGGHNFNATVTPTASAASASTSMTAVSSMTGITQGSIITHANIQANTTVARITSTSALTLSLATTGAISGAAVTVAGDVFKIALVKVTPAGTWNETATNVGTPGSGAASTSNLGTDETSGTGYSSGGVTLTNVSPVTSGTTAYITFSDPSWTTASFSTVAAIIYNSSLRLAGVTNRVVSVHDLGGTQTVTAGTLTLSMPVAAAATAIIRLA